MLLLNLSLLWQLQCNPVELNYCQNHILLRLRVRELNWRQSLSLSQIPNVLLHMQEEIQPKTVVFTKYKRRYEW